MYKFLIRPVFFRFNPETAHNLTMSMLGIIRHIPFARKIVRAIYGTDCRGLSREVFGLRFKNPVGLAGGLDKNGEHYNELSDFGFSFIEIGSLTPEPQDGNPKPRLFRVVQDQGAGIRVDPGKGIIDVGEQMCGEVRRLVALVGRPAGIIAHNRMGGRGVCMGCLFAGGGNGPHRRPQQQEDGAEQDCPPQKMVRKSHGMLLFSRIDGSIVPKIGQ